MDYLKISGDVFEFIGRGLIVIGAYYFGRYMWSKYKSIWKNILTIILIVGFISCVRWNSYGTHTEDTGDGDPLYGGGTETVVDFVPTDTARNEYGMTTFLVLSIPALYGIYKKKKEEEGGPNEGI